MDFMVAESLSSPPEVRGYSGAMRQLQGLQKTSKGAPAYSRFINRRLGRHLAASAFAVGLNPNQVTALSALCSFSAISAVALLRPSAAMAVVVTLALVVGYALDSADGQLARLRGGGSLSGEWLDHVIDSMKITTLHAAVLISVYRFFGFSTAGPLLIPIIFGVVASVWFFTVLLTDQLRRQHHQAAGTPVVAPGTRAPLVRSFVILPLDYGVMCLVFLFLPLPKVFLTVYALLLVGHVLYLGAALVKWYHELSSFDRSHHAMRDV